LCPDPDSLAVELRPLLSGAVSAKELSMSSTTGDSRQNAPFREIPLATCERLLSEHTVGRVAWRAPDGPELVPVNYAYNNKTIVFRTV
jgi:Pyridoxamine 5'-phosphate oxidase